MISFIAGALAKAVLVGVVEYYRPGTTTQVVNFLTQIVVKAIDSFRK
jgi:hypothetical protein